MPPAERWFNYLLALSILTWAVFGIVDPKVSRPIAVKCAISGLNLCVGVLILIRTRTISRGSIVSVLSSLPALVFGGLALHFAPSGWNFIGQALFVVGAVFAIASLVSLGRCFAILPAFRGVVSGGTYRLVRHPIYLGEFVMIFACWIAAPNGWWCGGVALLSAPMIAIRIRMEENLLRDYSEYVAYCEKVRWRWIPGVW